METVQHGNAQGAPGHERMQADVEVAALPVLLKESCPHMSKTRSVSERRCSVFALAYQAKLKEHRIVDSEVKRQLKKVGLAVAVQP